jgi:flagellar biosynthesis chaperone FliJ
MAQTPKSKTGKVVPAQNLDSESVSSPMWETLMEKLDRAWAENKIDRNTYEILLEALEESEARNMDVENA